MVCRVLLLSSGDLRNEEAVLEWLIDDDNRELADEIEDVNARMLEKLIDDSPFLAVLFYDEDCDDCDEVLKELEVLTLTVLLCGQQLWT